MRKFLVLIGTLTFLLAVTQLPNVAVAADAKEVLRACDRMAAAKAGSCNYTANKDNGDVSGCTKNVCFYCPADGKGQCNAVIKKRNGRLEPVAGDLMGMMTGASPSSQSARTPPATGAAPPH